MSLLSFRESGNEVHTDFIPFPLRDCYRAKSASRPLMFSLDTTIDVAFSNELSNFSLHSSPPEPLTKILVHFGATRMDRKRGFMSFLKNQLLQISLLWHY